ncbi:MAG TPA: UDP-N-acetylglucosamine--N-acetylmuramyl-(pentapeptide) pyrophosphoryl-undecaprenol N-acetylglucosamine transferase [Acidimicrobiia bacterium]|nr:UDP-N-acetylglucosamine--N-acetylmuramyl-(pentapeptide) pyrophosphoryl-undecaprenol N-acetylglucosamine transferase [Acidimicrobiia bacterium]
MSIVLAAAGTGGHVIPAIAVAESMVAAGLDRSQVVFFGGDRMEATLVPDAGFAFTGFRLTRFRRSLSPRNLAIPFALRRSAAAMAEEMDRVEARAVLGMGGYVSVPAVRAAARVGSPFFLQEQNAVPGLATRLAARRAKRVFLGLPGPAERLPRSSVVGNPLRSGFTDFERAAIRPAARIRYGISADGPVVGILGGSLGARVLNEAAPAIVEAVAPSTVLHITGETADAQVAVPVGADDRRWIRIPYEHDPTTFYAACDLVVCRAGAMTVSELAATGTPAVLVPLRRVGQNANAAALAEAGGAIVVDEEDVPGITDIVAGVLRDPERLNSMAVSTRRLARPGAADEIASILLEAARG